jgi:hypothetical protein
MRRPPQMIDIENARLINFCRRELALKDAKLGDEYGYGSLPLCVIDAVFSIGVRYESVRNVIGRYCKFFHLSETAVDQQIVQQMLDNYRHYGVDFFTAKIYANRQRTSARNGILKSEAVLRFASVLRAHGVNVKSDVRKVYDVREFEAAIRSIPGQTSGLSLRYFFMLSGNDEFVKPDRMITRFLQRVLGRAVSMDEAQLLISSACRSLRPDFPHLTPRLLDHAIWNYERDNGAAMVSSPERCGTTQQMELLGQ